MNLGKGIITGFFTPILSLFFIKKEYRIVLPLFYFYTGLSIFLVTSGPGSESDIYRTVERYSNFSGNSFVYNLKDLFSELVSFSKVDFGDSFIYTLMSLLETQDYLVIPLIALFQGLLIVKLFKSLEELDLLNYHLLFFLVIVLNPVATVNQFRFYTAMILLFNGFLLYNQNSRLMWLYFLGAIIFHFSLTFLLPFFLIRISNMKIYKILIVFLIASFFVSSLSFIYDFSSQFLVGEFLYRADSYNGDNGESLISDRMNRPWYAMWREITYYALQLLFLIPLFNKLKKKYINLFSLLLIVCIVLNTISSFSMFFRFATVVLIMLVSLFSLTIKFYNIFSWFKIYILLVMTFAGLMALSQARFFLRARYLFSNIFYELFNI